MNVLTTLAKQYAETVTAFDKVVESPDERDRFAYILNSHLQTTALRLGHCREVWAVERDYELRVARTPHIQPITTPPGFFENPHNNIVVAACLHEWKQGHCTWEQMLMDCVQRLVESNEHWKRELLRSNDVTRPRR